MITEAEKEHKYIHLHLHEKLEEIVADFITHTDKLPTKTSVYELLMWSLQQRDNPTPLEQKY